ncbi:hypothetical protein T01_3268 [Trichinella spiralis]|uniref:Uncharacterized protein n=1 Tax=Trichinella spiralis TaxID=6334 RepID=A0A0V1BQZ0_TRISP|nr:hypothetical protein T01_3268 [Trichinella spiralis]
MYKLFSSLFGVVHTIVGVMNLLPAFLVFFLANLRCEFAIRYRYPYFKFELEDEYMELFRYSNLPTEGKTFTIICYNDLDWGSCMYHHAFSAYTFPCPEYCEVRGNDTYCKIEPSGGKPIFCRSEYIHYMAFSYYLADDSNGSCVSCDATNSSKLMFTYKNFIRFRQFESAPCNSLTECADTHFYEDVQPVDYYEDGDFHRTSHCDILSKDIVEIPSVLIFSDANIAPGIPFQIYLVDEINEKKRLLRYFEFVELPVGGTLYFEINSVELVTCYLYTDDSFIGFFAVSALNPTISLEEIRHNYGICEFEMLCEGRLNAFHSSIVAYTRQTFVILDMGLNRRKDADTFGNRVTFRRGNNQYAVKVKAIVLVIFQFYRMITVWRAFIIESLSLLLMTVIVRSKWFPVAVFLFTVRTIACEL